MAKHNGTGGLRGGRGTGAIVDVVHRRQATRLAKISFWVVLVAATPTVAVVAAAVTDTLTAVAIGVITGLAAAVAAAVVALVWPVLRLVWWWTGELAALGLLLAGYLWLTRHLPWPAAVGLMSVVAGGLLMYGPSRRLLTAWVWCAISRHRLRTCFATFIRVNRRGSIPLILFAWPTPAGERVWVLLRPGLSIEDLTTDGGLSRLAVGCWAHEVRITRAFARLAPLIRIDITRRNPLADTIISPLAELVPPMNTLADPDRDSDLPDLNLPDGESYDPDRYDPDRYGSDRYAADGPDVDGLNVDGLGLDLPDVPDPTLTDVTFRRGKPSTTTITPGRGGMTTTAGTTPPPAAPRSAPPSRPPASEPGVLGRGGEDITDWV